MTALPPGQRERTDFPRFGLGRFAKRFPANPTRRVFSIGGDVATEIAELEPFDTLDRVDQTADFHCVTSWSVRNLDWSGIRFADVHRLICEQASPAADAKLVVFRGQDGYCCALLLDDLLRDGVMLADRLNGEPLGLDHGAPFRLVAPAHYGFKNVKHIGRIEYWRDARHYRFPFPYPSFMDHPRGRVALEERGRFFPAWLLRTLYRLLIPSSVWNFRRALRKHEGQR